MTGKTVSMLPYLARINLIVADLSSSKLFFTFFRVKENCIWLKCTAIFLTTRQAKNAAYWCNQQVSEVQTTQGLQDAATWALRLLHCSKIFTFVNIFTAKFHRQQHTSVL